MHSKYCFSRSVELMFNIIANAAYGSSNLETNHGMSLPSLDISISSSSFPFTWFMLFVTLFWVTVRWRSRSGVAWPFSDTVTFTCLLAIRPMSAGLTPCQGYCWHRKKIHKQEWKLTRWRQNRGALWDVNHKPIFYCSSLRNIVAKQILSIILK